MLKAITYFSLCALVVGGFYYFDRKVPTDEVWWENERYRSDLQHQIEITRLRVDRLERGPEPEQIEQASKELEALTARFDKLMKQHESLSAGLSGVESEFIAFREKRLEDLRDRATGKEWPEFVAASGRILKNAMVISVDDTGVMLRHEDGSTRMRFEDLTEKQRFFFGLEEGAAIAAMKEEQLRLQNYEEWVRSETEAANIKELVQRNLNEIIKLPTARKPLPQAKRFRSEAPAPEVASNDNSSLKIKSLSDGAQKVNINPRFRVRGAPRYYNTYNYYNCSPAYSAPSMLSPRNSSTNQ